MTGYVAGGEIPLHTYPLLYNYDSGTHQGYDYGYGNYFFYCFYILAFN